MSVSDKLFSSALDLAKSSNLQDKTFGLVGMLYPYLGINKKAVDIIVDDIENSDLSSEEKVIALFDVKRRIKHHQRKKSLTFAIESA